MGTITIAEIRQKPKRSVIITTERRQLGCWTDKIGKLGLEQGATYNFETEDHETNNGTILTNIVNAKRVTLGAPVPQDPANPQPSGQPISGAPFRTPEQITTAEIVCAYIANGRCPPEKLAETIGYVRRAWNSHWGEVHREAAE